MWVCSICMYRPYIWYRHKREAGEPKWAQTSTTKPKWAWTKAERAQTKHQRNQNKHQQARAKAKQEWGPANEWRAQTSSNEHEDQPAAVSMNEQWWAQTRAGEHEQGLPKQTAGQVQTRAGEHERGLPKWMAGCNGYPLLIILSHCPH